MEQVLELSLMEFLCNFIKEKLLPWLGNQEAARAQLFSY